MRYLQNRQACIVSCKNSYVQSLALKAHSYPCYEKFPPAASLIRTTTGVSMAEGSPAANVLPQKSSITVNFRMMPGTTLADVKEHIKKVVKKRI